MPKARARPPFETVTDADLFLGNQLCFAVYAAALAMNKTYRPLLHAPWHGLTLADVVFPLFLFLVGACVALAIDPDKLAQALTYNERRVRIRSASSSTTTACSPHDA